MRIIIDKAHGAMWHRDCPKNKWKSGIMMTLNNDNEKELSLVECLHCKQKGNIPYGTPFQVEVNIPDA